MGYKIVEIDTAWKLKLFLGNMQIFKGEDKITIPLNDIDVLIINTTQVLISQSLLVELANCNVLTILCDSKHKPCCNVLPLSGNYNSLKIIEKQIKWDFNFKSDIWKKIIKLKIASQIDTLKYFKIDSKNLNAYYENVLNGDASNREAISSKEYFKLLFGSRFDREDENDSYNVFINSFLNYGYIVLMSMVARSVSKNGLDNRIGVFHKSFNNHFALACDLMEPFRCLIDTHVYKLVFELKEKRNVLDTEAKHALIDLMTRQIKIGGEIMSLSLAIDKFVHSIIDGNLITNIQYLHDQY